jgi:lysophospholipase L1-like esterase
MKLSCFRTVAINVMVFVVFIAALVAIFEVVFRFLIPRPEHHGLARAVDSPLVYEMKPNLRVVREGVDVHTNSDGFRDNEFTGEPFPGQFLIAWLGDSFVFGQGVPQSETCPAVLQEILNRSSEEKRFRVWNLGVSGYNIEQEAHLLSTFVLPRKPNWVVVGLNLNDYEPVVSDSEWVPADKTVTMSVKDRIKEWFSHELMTGYIIKLRIVRLAKMIDPATFSSSYVQDLNDQYLHTDGGWNKVSVLLKKMKSECSSANVGFTLAIFPVMLDFSRYPFQEVHEVIMRFCQNNAIDCVDLAPYFKGQKDEDLWVSIIDPHPNSQAQRIFAGALANHLKMVLGQQDSN